MKYRDFTKWNIPESEKDIISLSMEKIKNNEHSPRASKDPEQLADYYLDKWKMPLEYINLDFMDPGIEERVDCFIKDFKANKLKKKIIKRVGNKLKEVDGGDYKGKKKFTQALGVYVSLRYADKFEDLKDRLLKKINKVNFYKENKEPETLDHEEIEKLIAESNSEYTARIEIEGVGGPREGEAESILMKGVKLADPEQNRPFVEIEITKSKTALRPIKLYSKKSDERVRAFYNKRVKEGADPEDKFFTKTHNAFRQYLKRLGKRVLNKHVHPHMLRASAVTNNIERGLIVNESEMNVFYGWAPGTGTCRKYINGKKLTLKETDKKANEKIFGKNPKTIQDLEFEKKVEIEALKKDMDELKKESEFFKAFIQGKKWEDVKTGKKVFIPQYNNS